MPAAICRRPTAHGSAPRGPRPVRRKRVRSLQPEPSWRWQPDGEARPFNHWLALVAGRSRAILRPDAPAMGLDDLLGYRQSQSGILSKALMRPVGIETLEDPFQRVVSDPRAIIVDDDFHFRSDAPANDAHLAA